MSIPLKKFYMIRHGETEANAARLMAESIDTPLTQNGYQQANEARKVLEKLEHKPAAIFHSNLSRARDTASTMNKNLKRPMYEDCEELFNGWPIVDSAETPNEFFMRIKRGKTKALERFNDPILIVCHGGVMRAFSNIYGFNTPGRFQNAHLYEFNPIDGDHKFPWDVYDYRLCEESGELLKNRAEIYYEV
jgi:broad specificity phosphatase PhoE